MPITQSWLSDDQYDFIKKSGTELEPVYDWRVGDRIYKLTETTFTKRQPKPHERERNIHGDWAEYPWVRERLENERDALIFISKNTTIPVPRVLDWYEDEGAGTLVVEAVQGYVMDELMDTLPPEKRQILKKNVDDYMYNYVLPQLAALRSKRVGALSGIAMPPPRVHAWDDRTVWQVRTSNVAKYVYCHNDLSRHNIFVDPETLQVVSIIDWEYSGFYPPEFERQIWHQTWPQARTPAEHEEKVKESHRLAAIFDEPGDLFILFLTNTLRLISILS